MPTEDQMERLLLLLDAQQQKRKTKRKLVLEEIHPEERKVPVEAPVTKGSSGKTKKPTKKEKEAEKEREINAKMEQYLKPPTKKPKANAIAVEKPEPAPATEPAQPKMPEPAPTVQAPAPTVSAQPKASDVQNITTIISEIKATIQPEIDTFKLNQINSFIKSYKNRHI